MPVRRLESSVYHLVFYAFGAVDARDPNPGQEGLVEARSSNHERVRKAKRREARSVQQHARAIPNPSVASDARNETEAHRWRPTQPRAVPAAFHSQPRARYFADPRARCPAPLLGSARREARRRRSDVVAATPSSRRRRRDRERGGGRERATRLARVETLLPRTKPPSPRSARASSRPASPPRTRGGGARRRRSRSASPRRRSA